MERIKAALERAQQERQQSGTMAGASSAPLGGGTGSVDSIQYSKTRTIQAPKRMLREQRIITGFEPGHFVDAYKMLRTQVLQRLTENNWNALAITSPGEHEGKTITAINLAISLAMEVNYTVLLVDADLRHPSIHSYFGFRPEYGLSDYLTRDIPLAEMLVHPEGIGHCVILPGGSALINSAEMLSSPKMVQLVDELKNRYPSRIVLFDLPPLLSAADTLAFSPYADAALLVIEEGKTKAEEVARANELLQGTNVLGTVLNKSQPIPETAQSKTPGWLRRLISG